MTLTPAQRRSITQRTGAVVRLEGEEGVVTGHYDDDIVYVDFGRGPETCYVAALEFIATRKAPLLTGSQRRIST